MTQGHPERSLELFLMILFFILRIFLDIHELSALDEYRERKARGCLPVPLWAMVVGSVSQVLLVLNCSVNFAIYCCMSREFRQVYMYIEPCPFAGC